MYVQRRCCLTIQLIWQVSCPWFVQSMYLSAERLILGTFREAPLKITQCLFGHCPNSDCPPPPALNWALWGTLFSDRFEQLCQITALMVYKCPKVSWQALSPSLTKANAYFNFNFHCISARNHPGKGSDQFEFGQFFSK